MMFKGSRIKKLRKQKGLSLEKFIVQLSEKMNMSISRQTASNWEEELYVPNVNEGNMIAKFFDKPLSYFTDGDKK